MFDTVLELEVVKQESLRRAALLHTNIGSVRIPDVSVIPTRTQCV